MPNRPAKGEKVCRLALRKGRKSHANILSRLTRGAMPQAGYSQVGTVRSL